MKAIKILLTVIILFAVSYVAVTDITSLRSSNKRTVLIAGDDIGGADTVTIYPRNDVNILTPEITDSVVYVIGNVYGCRKGDQLKFCITDSAGGAKVRLNGLYMNFLGADSVFSISTTKKAYIEFFFDGSKFMQSADAVVQ